MAHHTLNLFYRELSFMHSSKLIDFKIIFHCLFVLVIIYGCGSFLLGML